MFVVLSVMRGSENNVQFIENKFYSIQAQNIQQYHEAITGESICLVTLIIIILIPILRIDTYEYILYTLHKSRIFYIDAYVWINYYIGHQVGIKVIGDFPLTDENGEEVTYMFPLI